MTVPHVRRYRRERLVQAPRYFLRVYAQRKTTGYIHTRKRNHFRKAQSYCLAASVNCCVNGRNQASLLPTRSPSLALTCRHVAPRIPHGETIYLCRCHGLVTLSFTNQPVVEHYHHKQYCCRPLIKEVKTYNSKRLNVNTSNMH